MEILNFFLYFVFFITGVFGILFFLFRKKLLSEDHSKLLMRILYYPVLPIVYIKATYITGWYSDLGDGVILGGLPKEGWNSISKMQKKHNIYRVINLCDEWNENEKLYSRLKIQQLYLPTCDYWQPTYESILKGVAFLADSAKKGIPVYVHCRAGVGRSATICLCYWLFKDRTLTPETAQNFLLSKRKVAKNLKFRRQVKNFYEQLQAGNVDSLLSNYDFE